VGDTESAELCLKGFRQVSGLLSIASQSGLVEGTGPGLAVAVCELILEGLHAHKKISRSDERGYTAAKQETRNYGYESFSRSRRVN